MLPERYILFLFGVGILVLLVAWLPLALRKVPLSLAIIYVGLGAVVFSSGWLGFEPDPQTYDTIVERLTEAVVIIALMGAGLKLDRPIGWRAWATTWRLLGLAMPLTILAVTLLAVYYLNFPVAMALLFAAALAPTDPVLASDVQVGPPRSGDDGEVRFALTSEAGLNDGLAFPFVHLALVFGAAATMSAQTWPTISALGEWLLIDVVWRVAAGVAIGWLTGRILGWLTFDMPHLQLSGTGDGLVAIGATMVAYAIAETFHSYGFLAVFVTALVLRNSRWNHKYHEALHDFAEQIERLLMMLILILFGGAIATGIFSEVTWSDVAIALVIIFVIRPLAGWVSLIGVAPSRRERALMAFLGIRGIGSFYYVAYGINHGDFGTSDRLWGVTSLVVLLSILIHGITATPLMLWLDRTAMKRTRSA